MLPTLTSLSASKDTSMSVITQTRSMNMKSSQIISPIGKQKNDQNTSDVKMGKVCKICDRKFFMWSTYNMYQEQMEN